MSSPQPPQAECKWCGEKLTEGAEQCPLCKRPVTGGLRPIGDAVGTQRRSGVPAPSRPAPPPPPRWQSPREREPVIPAPGQEEFGSWASIRYILRADKAFGAMLALMALVVAVNLLTASWFSAFISGAVLWGIITFRWWGYLLAMVGAGIGAFIAAMILVAFLRAGGGGASWALLPLATDCFVLVVLYTRRDRFD